MKFDNVLLEIDGFGKFQLWLFLIQVISRMTLPCHFLLNNFMAAVPDHHCDISSLEDGGVFGNLTYDQKLAVGIPTERDGTPRSCQMFSKPQYQLLSGSNSSEDTVTVRCQNGWVYDNSTFKSTLVTEWDLVCERKGMNKATATIFFIGVMIGAPLFGLLSDRFGRRPLLLVSYVSSLTFAVLSAFSTSYVLFVIMRFFTGMSLAGISIISIVLNIEWFSIEHRTFCGIIISLDWTIGNWFLVGAAYYINEWRMLIVAVTSPLILSIIAWRWVPESARWLMANGKVDAAHMYIMKCAEMNNRSKCMASITPATLLESADTETAAKKYTVVDLFRTPNIRKLAICTGVVWYGVAFTYYGISLNITGFGLNPYLTQFIFASTEMPMKIGVYFFLKKVGRRKGEMGALLSTALCLFINMFVSKDKWVSRTVVAVLGKSLSEASFTIIFLYTTELYPTVVRQNGLGYTSFLARLGVSISPLIMLLEDVWHHLPAVIYCTMAVVSGLVASLLPETLNAQLPEFIEDIEKPSSLDDGGLFRNLSLEERLTVSIPVQQDGTPHSCQMFAEPQYHLLFNSSNITDLLAVPCQNGWVYDNTTFKSTLATQWDLVCDKRRMNRAMATVFFMGVMAGAALFGYLSDRFGVTCAYYGISLNVAGFSANIYLTQFIYGVVEIPAKAFVYFSVDKIGRRLNQAAFLFLAGLCIFCNMFIPQERGNYRTAVEAVGKMFAEAAFTTVFLYTTELYPTVMRQNGMGFCSFMARVGVSVSPMILILEELWVPLPSIIFVLVAFTGGLSATFLPETKNVRLPETIEDVEHFRTQSNSTSDEFLRLSLFQRKTHSTQWEATMKFEDVLADINGFGKFQIMIIVISFIGRFTLPCHFMLNNFIAAVPSHHCDISTHLDDRFSNLSQAERLIVSVPFQQDGTPSSCEMFVEPQYHLLFNSDNASDVPTVPCQNGWVYDNTTFKSTLTSEWDLVCDSRGKNKATATIFFVGVMFGAVAFGSLSDRFGRRIMLLVSYVSAMVFGVASVFSTSYVMFAVLRFFTGFCINGIVIVSAVLSVEWVDIKHRRLVGLIDSLSWTFGYTVFALIGYCVNEWRRLVFSVTLPLILGIITWRWMPESARWLIANGKLDQAKVYLQKCAEMNRTKELSHTLKAETLSTIVLTDKKERIYTYLDLIRTPKMRQLALCTGILWFCVAITFYGISFNTAGFGLNIYLTQFIYASVELPAKVTAYFLFDYIGRRSTQMAALLLAGTCIGLNIVIPNDMPIARTVVAVIGKGFSASSFTTVVLYSSELYPTVVRQNGMGYNSFMARFGVAVAPLVLLLDEVWKDLPQAVFCCTAILGGVVARTLSETRNRCLPETIEDIEKNRQ
ncbi:uncharacterized protein LOC125003430 [Mugil cephalus]|uniref:uncharacterized protein LOC125003430 n=1 Tax=Mugil cephalus TaxID=48193 RepID=UPI001FB75764|nr:uncharacterized protein LOC125003430 [Mugil cephalus]